MPGSADLCYDVASAICLGQREIQEDAIICDFPLGSNLGFAVLSDGMGGHAAGDTASKIVVTEVFSELKLQSGDPRRLEQDITDILLGAAMAANDCIGSHAGSEPGTRGMGATLVAPVLIANRLYWVSVGDSPLLLYRDGTLSQLNEDHSMAPQIDYLARSGIMSVETAMNHPDRNCLTSVLAGQQIDQIDCPGTPVQLMRGDIVIAASDGLQFLANAEIADLLGDCRDKTSAEISGALLRCLAELDDPDQDNVSFCVIRALSESAGAGAGKLSPPSQDQIASPQELPDAKVATGKVTVMATKSDKSLSVVYRISSERSA